MSLFLQVMQELGAERQALGRQELIVQELLDEVEDARTHAVALARRLDVARQRHKFISSRCNDLLADLMREFFVTAPEDILVLIFEEVKAIHEGWNCGFMLYDQGRSRAPFRLAAVCRRWRRVAISTSILWTYIAVHKPGSVSLFLASVFSHHGLAKHQSISSCRFCIRNRRPLTKLTTSIIGITL